MSQYGVVRSVSREQTRDGLQTNTRRVIMGIREPHVPQIVKATYSGIHYEALVTIAGRPMTCFRCNRPGHRRVECTTPLCSKCREFGRYGDCTKMATYAAMSKPLQIIVQLMYNIRVPFFFSFVYTQHERCYLHHSYLHCINQTKFAFYKIIHLVFLL